MVNITASRELESHFDGAGGGVAPQRMKGHQFLAELIRRSGASAEVAGFLSVASKAGAFALMVRFALALSGAPGTESFMIAFGVGIGFIACITTTFGNLAAYSQTNLKRLLAYSTIAHPETWS